ncbi:MAG: PAS domain-containing protein [Anaerolineales bacterium]|nr:PAS domain-containing protein [Anaerolineales bacterium]
MPSKPIFQTGSISPVQVSRNVEPNLACQLLDQFPQPAILLNSNYEIWALNWVAAELAGHDRPDLVGKTLWLLFPYIIGGAQVTATLQELPGESVETILHVKDGKRVPVSVKIQTLTDASTWSLLTFETIQAQQRRYTQQLHATHRIYHASQLLEALTRQDLSALLESGLHLLNATILALYLADTNYPRMKRFAYLGRGTELPRELSSEEAQQLIKTGRWFHNQRNIATITHQIARSTGFAYLACAPIGDHNAPIGILLVADQVEAGDKEFGDLINIIALAIHQYIKIQAEWNAHRAELSYCRTGKLLGEAVFNHNLDGVLIVNADLKLVRINSLAELQLGYASAEVHQQPIDNILIGTGTDRLLPALELALEGVPTHSIGTVRLHRRDGSTFPAAIGVVPAPDIEQHNYALILLQDISEHEDIRMRSQQLEQRALLGEITAVFAHEVRNPINNLSTGLQLLERNLPAENAENQDLIGRLQQECNRLTSLMDSVLTFSRTGNYKLVPLDMPEFLERIINRWRPHMSRYKVNHHIQAPEILSPVYGDRRALEQVLTNLISNAIHAMQGNGGTLAFKLSELEHPGQRRMVQLDISDTGPGIPAEIRDRIFEPFFTTDPNGTGLGLSISKQIITAHKGTINLTTFPGGTIFHVRLPVHDKDDEEILL